MTLLYNNKNFKRSFLAALFCATVGLVAGEIISQNVIPQPISEEQMVRLLQAAWKEEVNTIDATAYIHTFRKAESEDAIRQRHEKVIQTIIGNPENLTGEKKEQYYRDVQRNVERDLQLQQTGQKTRSRIRIDGKKQRVDSTNIQPEIVLLKDTSYEENRPATIIQEDSPYEMTYIETETLRFFISNSTETVNIDARKSPPPKHDIQKFYTALSILQPFLGAYGGTEYPQYTPDTEKIQHLKETGDNGKDVSLVIFPNMSQPNERVQIEVISRGTTLIRAISDTANHSIVYEYVIFNPLNGKLLLEQTFDRYDSNGYPHYVTSKEYDFNGVLKVQKTYEFEKVDLSSELSPEIFEPVSPPGYTVYDRRDPEKFKEDNIQRKVQQETAQEIFNTQDVKQIQALLTHPQWEIRIQALVQLRSLLKNKPNELAVAAGLLKDDPVPAVRKVANEILDRTK